MAADPTYPLFPIASILCSALLLLVLTTSFLRQRWNLGVSALCFGLVLENLAGGINSILWADNTDIKAGVYCDIVTHIYMFMFILKPACSLVITRHLYKFASMHPVDMADMSQRVKRFDRFIEIFLVFFLPAMVTGLYYINQRHRFEVVEGFGCTDTFNTDGVSVILLQSWPIILPLISALFYIPRILCTFYRLKKETSQFVNTDDSLSHSFYFRILLLGCLDILFTLPIGIANLVIVIEQTKSITGNFPFYWGWAFNHTDWAPSSTSYAELQSSGTWALVEQYLSIHWASVVLGYIIFALFGLTTEAKMMYLTWFYRGLGQSPPLRNPIMSGLVFGACDLPVDSSAEQDSQLGIMTETLLEEGGIGSQLEESKDDHRQI